MNQVREKRLGQTRMVDLARIVRADLRYVYRFFRQRVAFPSHHRDADDARNQQSRQRVLTD